MTKPEKEARAENDRLLAAAGWSAQSVAAAGIHASHGVAIQEFPLGDGHGFADYRLYVDGNALGVLEAKKKGHTLSGVAVRSDKYLKGLPSALPAWRRPFPFTYKSNGVETSLASNRDRAHFTSICTGEGGHE